MMDIPTFPEAPAKHRRPISDTIARLRQGDTSRDVLLGLNDLTRAEATELRTAWPLFAAETRLALVQSAVESAELDVTLHFGRLFRVASRDEDARSRYTAITGLWEDRGPGIEDLLTELLGSDPNADVQAEAMSLLGKIAAEHVEAGETTDAEHLREVIARYAGEAAVSGIVRRRAVEALGGFGVDTDVVAILEGAYDDDDTAMKAAAIYGMGRTGSQQWSGIFLNELSSQDPELRYEAARACGQIALEDAVGPLAARARDDDDAEVRLAAISALGEIGGPAALRQLRELARTASELDLEEIESVLEESLLSTDAMGAVDP